MADKRAYNTSTNDSAATFTKTVMWNIVLKSKWAYSNGEINTFQSEIEFYFAGWKFRALHRTEKNSWILIMTADFIKAGILLDSAAL